MAVTKPCAFIRLGGPKHYEFTESRATFSSHSPVFDFESQPFVLDTLGAQPVPHVDFESQQTPRTVRPYPGGSGPPFWVDLGGLGRTKHICV